MPAHPKWLNISLAAILLPALGGVPLAAPQQAQEPVVRVTTRLVLVNVVVQDRKGAPVVGLTRDDFTLFDEGEQQPISLFAVEKAGAAAAEPLPPNTFSNRPQHLSGGQRSVTVILLDFLNTQWQDRVYAKQQVVRFLQQLQPDDRVALYALGKRLTILHNFTSDARPLLRSLDRHRDGDVTHISGSEPQVSDTGDAEIDDQLNEQFQAVADFYVQDRARRTSDALIAIANHLAPFPGRKSLVWVSGSFPIHIGMDEMVLGSTRDRRTFTDEIDAAARALNNANLAVYPVDARGLVVGMTDASQGARGRALRQGRPPGPLFNTRALAQTHETMNLLADRTGGRAFYNTNDIHGAIRRAIDDASVSYVLGYYPSHQKWDGKYRRIRVRLKRDGARIRYRDGYFAYPLSPQSISLEQRNEALRAEVVRPLRSGGLGLTVQVGPFRAAGATTLRLTLYINASQLSFEEQGDRWAATVDLMFGQLYEEGTRLHSQTQTANLRLPRAEYEQVTATGLNLSKLVELLPDAEELIVVARDVPNGYVGSVVIPLAPYRESPTATATPTPR